MNPRHELLFVESQKPSHGAALLEVSKVSIGYGSLALASDISITMQAGQSLALVGGNGSGKTTFLSTVAGLIGALAGSVKILGHEPRHASKSLAWLGQFHPSNPLLPMRVRDLVRMAHFPNRGLFEAFDAHDEEVVQAALEFVGMEKKQKKTLGVLSGGERQKVYLAYVLARRAPLVLLDEPQQNLDSEGEDLLALASQAWKRVGTSVITATHDAHEARQCDWVIKFPFDSTVAIQVS